MNRRKSNKPLLIPILSLVLSLPLISSSIANDNSPCNIGEYGGNPCKLRKKHVEPDNTYVRARLPLKNIRSLIAYICDGHICTMRPNGNNKSQLTWSDSEDSEPTWSPSHDKVAFVRDGDLYVVDNDGSNQIKLTYFINGRVRTPTWSPDGLWIAFIANSDGDSIYKAKVSSSSEVKLVASGVNISNPSWSPAGGLIAYQANDDIYVINDADKTVRNLTDDLSCPSDEPDWSPVADKIAFTYTCDDRTGISIMNSIDGADKSVLEETVGSPYGNEYSSPSWSPNGGKLSYTYFGYDAGGNESEKIHVINADGSGLIVISTSDYEGEELLDTSQSWSYDGNSIAFQHELFRVNEIDILTARADGSGGVKNLTPADNDFDNTEPSWE